MRVSKQREVACGPLVISSFASDSVSSSLVPSFFVLPLFFPLLRVFSFCFFLYPLLIRHIPSSPLFVISLVFPGRVSVDLHSLSYDTPSFPLRPSFHVSPDLHSFLFSFIPSSSFIPCFSRPSLLLILLHSLFVLHKMFL